MVFGEYILNPINQAFSNIPLSGGWEQTLETDYNLFVILIDICVVLLILSVIVVIIKMLRN